jgi:thioredoxin reductase
MGNKVSKPLDVAVIGGGPAGISACLELAKSPGLRVSLLEGDLELGGMPRSCHVFFGLRDRKWIYTGPGYARKMVRLVRKAPIEIHTGTRVLDIVPGLAGETHQLFALSPEGPRHFESRFLLLATGCFESSRSARLIPGARPAGIYTTGTLQELINLRHLKAGKRALIIGSEHVAFSSVLTLRKAGMSIAAVVEEDKRIQTYPCVAAPLSLIFGFPIYKDTSVKAILGNKRVEAVELVRGESQELFQVECDTVVMTGRFRPESSLIDSTPIEKDSSTYGPVVDMNLMTSVPNIFAAGNVLRGADMHDLCALEGKLAARSILKRLESGEVGVDPSITLRAEPPIRYVVPQRIAPIRRRMHLFSKFFPWTAIQVERTLKQPVIEACSGGEKIWEGVFSQLIANNRYPVPIEKFDWDRVDSAREIALRIKSAD